MRQHFDDCQNIDVSDDIKRMHDVVFNVQAVKT